MRAKKSGTALVLNGTIKNLSWLKKSLKKFERIIAVDGGLNYLDKIKVCPHSIIGDLDSASQELIKAYRDHVEFIQFPSDKDFSDFEIALEYVQTLDKGPVTVFGGEGGRLDHTISNLFLLSRFPQRVILETEAATSYLVTGTEKIKTKVGQTISLLPFSIPLPKISTKGLKWDMNELELAKGIMSLSNVCLDKQIEINLEKGCVLVSLIKETNERS